METKWRRRLTYISIGLFYFMSGVEYAVILPTIWLYISKDFDAEEYMLGFLLSGYSLAAIIAGPILGRYADKTRKPKILIIFGILCEVAGSLMYFAGISVWFLLASRMVAGIGGGVEAVILAEVTRNTETKSRTGTISILVSIRQTGLLVGPGLNLFLREMNFDVDGFHVTKYNVPGAFMACMWVIQMFIIFFLYTDLHRMNVSSVVNEQVKVRDESSRSKHNVCYDYDEDIYKEIDFTEDCDKKSINSAFGSRSPTSDPDDLIETAEGFIEEGQRSRSHTPSSLNSFSVKAYSEPNSRPVSRSAKSIETNKSQKTSAAMVTDYGSIDVGSSCYGNEGRSRQGSHQYIESQENKLVDYLQGKSRLKFMYQEYVREEVVCVIAVQFNSFFNQLALETMVTPLSNKFLGWGELENSIMYCLAGLEVIIVFGMVTWLSKRVQDRSLILCGTIVLTVANSWMIYVIPVAGECSYYTNLWRFIIGIIIDMLALPMLVSGSISLYSKITRVETQGLSMGLRRSVVGMATILGPLWAGSAITRPYVMFGVMLALLALSLFMLVLSFSKLVPSSEQPVNKAGLVTTTDSDEDITQPLIT